MCVCVYVCMCVFTRIQRLHKGFILRNFWTNLNITMVSFLKITYNAVFLAGTE